MIRPTSRFIVCALIGAGLGIGCAEPPSPITPPGASQPVSQLSKLGIFQGDVRDQLPAPGFVPYDVNVHLYSDAAHKYRFIYVPPGKQLHANAGYWDLPVGSIVVKTFYFPWDERDPSKGKRLVETRFLVRNEQGFQGSTYLWNEDQTDAVASGGNVNVPVDWIDSAGDAHHDRYHVPGVSQCMDCHRDRALGFRTAQLDLAGEYDDGTKNQIEHLVALGLLDAPPEKRGGFPDPLGDAPLEERARSYLDVNCAHCHGPGGEAEVTQLLWDYEHTDASQLPFCRHTTPVDGRDQVIVPGHPEQSEFLARMVSTDPFVRMPRGPTHVPDAAGIAMLTSWVASMTPGGCP